MKMTTILEDLLQKGYVGVLLSTAFDETNGDLKAFTFLEGVTKEDRQDLIDQRHYYHPEESLEYIEALVDAKTAFFTAKAREFCDLETIKEQEAWWENNSGNYRCRHLMSKTYGLLEIS